MKPEKNSDSGLYNFGVVILAGGKSSRMNSPKVWLSLENGQSFVEALSQKYEHAGFTEIVVVLNAEFASDDWSSSLSKLSEKVHVVLNNRPELGRIFSLKEGLHYIRKSNFVFIQNVDNPIIKEDTLKLLCRKVERSSITIPEFGKKAGHPIVADVHLLRNLLRGPGTKETLRQVLLPCHKKRVVVNDPGVLVNINTVEAYEAMMHDYVA